MSGEAINRLEAWLRDFGDPMQPEFTSIDAPERVIDE